MDTKIPDTLNTVRSLEKEQFEVLYSISKALNAAVYKKNLFEETLDIIIRVIDAERALFVMYDEPNTKFSIVAARNVKQETIDDLSTFSSGILQKVIAEKRPIIYHDVQSAPGISQFQSVLIHQIKSVLGVPVFRQGKIAGLILADSQMNRKAFNEENLYFLDFFSNLVSLALDRISQIEELIDENTILKNQLQTVQKIPGLIGQSPAIKQLVQMIERVARTDTTVLLLGESGTGKDLAARAIHELSERRQKPYLAQFCGSIPDSLLESELFGYKKGAFTGAVADKKGLFEVASSGTFFLDEIADISIALQAKLLRVLQNKEIIRLGDTQSIKIDTRIITATNKDLKILTKEGKFREDLFYRLNVFPIYLPPLRERTGDIPLLAEHFILRYFGKNITVHPETMKRLNGYQWPGNIRQLENVIQRAAILCDGDILLPEHIIIEEADGMGSFAGTLEDFERMILMRRLKEFNGNRTQTAKSLGVSVRWIQLKLKEIDSPDD
ncbi:MAG: sigma 54-interacting transcriptional regulator [Ignavibacteria bacterium]|nr:sigma 54-interacting transcriptional regulator [Ignavibacteria bacterium]